MVLRRAERWCLSGRVGSICEVVAHLCSLKHLLPTLASKLVNTGNCTQGPAGKNVFGIARL